MSRAGQFFVCASAAAAFGVYVLLSLGAPLRYLIINGVALAAGLALAAIMLRFRPRGAAAGGLVAALFGASLVATALFGATVEGATRWISLAGIAVQPSFLAAPLVIALFAVDGTLSAFIGVALAAIGLALQPDRAIAGAVFAALFAHAAVKPQPLAFAAAALAATAFIVALFRPDAVPPSPFVEGVVAAAFTSGPATGLAATLGLILLVAPFATGLRSVNAPVVVAVCAFWAAASLAALLGNYPTPFIGYGASAILGYTVSGAFALSGSHDAVR